MSFQSSNPLRTIPLLLLRNLVLVSFLLVGNVWADSLTFPPTTAAALTCSSCTLTGDTTFSGGQLLAPDGTVSNPAIAWTSDDDGSGTGFYRSATNRIGFATNGSNPVNILSTGIHLAGDAGFLFWGTSSDLLLSRDAAAVLQLGVDSNTPITQTIEALDAASGVSNGSNLVLRGGLKATTGQDGVVIVGRGYTVATLPTGTVVAGARAWVTDATACTFAAAPTGGGAVFCPVVYNGSAWVEG